MQKVSEYEQNAAECRQKAAQMTNLKLKRRLEDMAEVWDRLARQRQRGIVENNPDQIRRRRIPFFAVGVKTAAASLPMFCGLGEEPLGFHVCSFLGFPFAFVCFGAEPWHRYPETQLTHQSPCAMVALNCSFGCDEDHVNHCLCSPTGNLNGKRSER